MNGTVQPITVKASITDGEKHVVLIIQDITQIAALVAGMTGHSAIAQGIVGLSGLAQTAIEGYEDAAAVEITPESITSLLPDATPLAPASGSSQPLVAGTNEGAAYQATELDVNFLQSRGYKIATIEAAQAFINRLPSEQVFGYQNEKALWEAQSKQ